MRPILLAIALLLSLAGCESLRTVKSDNPVVGPPPPRVARAGSEKSRTANADHQRKIAARGNADELDNQIQTVSQTLSDSQPLADDTVIARVNESPIFARDVFEMDGPKLKAIDAKVEELRGTPSYPLARQEQRKYQEMLIKQLLPMAIDRRMLALAIRSSVKSEQYKQIQDEMDKNYKKVVEQRMKSPDIQASTPAEFNEKLRAKGYDPEQFRQMMNENFLATVYMQLKERKPPEPTRSDLLAYYKEHREEYNLPDQVKWQQIQVLSSRHGGPDKARERLDLAIDELLAGTPFPDVARKYSDGLTADEGGQWDWMKRNSLADKDLEQRLFNMPVGEVSPVLESDLGCQVVVVVDRREAGYRSFEEVQKEIAKTLNNQAVKDIENEILEELREDTVVWTMFDGKSAKSDRPEEDPFTPLTVQ